jgi:hypothetical protein
MHTLPDAVIEQRSATSLQAGVWLRHLYLPTVQLISMLAHVCYLTTALQMYRLLHIWPRCFPCMILLLR